MKKHLMFLSTRYQRTSLPNTIDSIDLFLQQSYAIDSIQQFKQLHAQVIVTGINQSAFLGSTLISTYSKFGFLNDARIVFQTIPTCKTNLLSWNSILRANLSHGFFEETLRSYLQMLKLGICPDGFSFPLIIRAISWIGNLGMIGIVHSHVVVMGFELHLHVANELITMYGKFGRMGFAVQVFDRMPQRNVVSWNTMVSGFALNCDPKGALVIFRRMESENWTPNLVTWTSLLSAHARRGQNEEVLDLFREMRVRENKINGESVAVVLSVCADLEALDMGKVIHGNVVRCGFESYDFVKNSLICLYGKCRKTGEAEVLFFEMEIRNLVSWNALISCYASNGLCNKAFEVFSQLEMLKDEKVKPNVVSWSAVIGGFASSGNGHKSLEIFRQMQIAGIRPNSITIATVLSACAELATLGLGKEIHGFVIRALLDRKIELENALVHMYSRCGSLEYGFSVFDRMVERNLISWNSMIAGYAIHGYGNEALGIFGEMIRAGLKPDGITFVALLSACSHAGLVDEGHQLFDQMVNDYKFSPQVEHYACMVDLLGRAGFVQEASEFVKAMPLKPNACVWGALLNSCRVHKNITVAEETMSRISNLESEGTGSYMLLSNIYAVSGRWGESANVRALAKIRGLKKSPGQSWIEVKKKIYMFSAGSISQTGLKKVHGVLDDLSHRMAAEGYVPDKSFVLQDVGDEEKKQILSGHSEKLAIAFGLLYLSINTPIRVMKNLRVCGDCHNWTKFFSKITGREVIVRDGQRFHRFKDGMCSCRDYW